jgi:hypothetical protein
MGAASTTGSTGTMGAGGTSIALALCGLSRHQKGQTAGREHSDRGIEKEVEGKHPKNPPKGLTNIKLVWRCLALGLWASSCGPSVVHPARIWAPHLSSSFSMELSGN